MDEVETDLVKNRQIANKSVETCEATGCRQVLQS
jgi:hypothetical protein